MRHSFFERSFVVGAMFACILIGASAYAGSVNPLLLEMEATGPKAVGMLHYKNDGAKQLALDLKIFRLKIDDNGKQALEPAQNDFRIFPPLVSIPAGRTQSIRVAWAGSPTLMKSESYIFSLKEAPVKFPDQKSGMQVVIDFNVVLNVAPINSTGAPTLVSAGFGPDEAGISRPQLVVENRGNRHISLSDSSITFTNGKWTETLTAPMLRQMIGIGLVQPGKRRRFLFPIPSAPQQGPLTARIDYEPLVTSATAK